VDTIDGPATLEVAEGMTLESEFGRKGITLRQISGLRLEINSSSKRASLNHEHDSKIIGK